MTSEQHGAATPGEHRVPAPAPRGGEASAARTFEWSWGGKTLRLGLEEMGSRADPALLLLPALSSISTRGEMRPLMRRLAGSFRTVALDWPGFGDRPRPVLDWRPEVFRDYLGFVLRDVVSLPHAIVAAGHGATYALHHAASDPGSIARLVLIAPTWRGPFPTMMGGQRPWFERLRRAVDAPVLGPLVYRLNVNRLVIEHMAAGHVYSERRWLSDEPDRRAQKLAVTRAPGARHASVRFVTGALDPADSREAFLDLARRALGAGTALKLVYGAETPARSRAEMEVLAARPGIDTTRLDRGKLSVHEEFAEPVAAAIAAFLAPASPAPTHAQ